jgi:predicted Zn-dependent protease
MISSYLKIEKLRWLLSGLFLILISTSISYAQSIELDKKLGAENAILVESQIGIYSNKKMTEYVSSIGNRLVAELEDNPFEFQFQIADDPIPNAFALPGGYVYVTRGILSLITNEDELACVMAHEIIHVTGRHSIKQMRSSILPHMLELPGAIVGNVVNEDLGKLLNTPITTSNNLLLSSYSRKHETESDTKGIELASKAGYDPNAMASILDRLSLTVEVFTNEKEKKSYFDDHPYTPDRVKKITKTTSKLSWEEGAKISEDFPSPLNGMVFGLNPRKGLFKGQTFQHPDLNFTLTFPDEWETSNQPSTVLAIHEDRQAGIFVGLEDPSNSPEEYAKTFEKALEEKHGQKPSLSESRSINNHPGYLITMEDKSGDEVMYIHILWLKMENKLFKLIGIAPRSLEPDLQMTVRSLRSLTSAERKAIQMRTVRIVKAKKNETIGELCDRTNNMVTTTIASLINGVEEDEELDKNQLVKIVVPEKYFKQ